MTSTRQIQLRGIQDGIQIIGVAAKTGAREITLSLRAVDPVVRWGRSYVLDVGFEA